jgi:hypothetical protein
VRPPIDTFFVYLVSKSDQSHELAGRSLGAKVESDLPAMKYPSFPRRPYPKIRMITMASQGSVEPADDLASKGWEVCAPHEAANFSAVGYYFARTIHRDLQIPVGIINSSIGGSPIRGWIARDAQDTIPELRESTEARLRLMRERDTDANVEVLGMTKLDGEINKK